MLANCDRLNEKLEKSEQRIEDLKSSLDAFFGSEELVEHLTEKNLELGEKVDSLKSQVEDLEVLYI